MCTLSPRTAWKRSPLVVYSSPLEAADQGEEVLVRDCGGGDLGEAGGGISGDRPGSWTIIKALGGKERASLILYSCSLHLHQLLEEGVVREAVLVRIGHAQSLEDLRLFGFVEAGQNVPGGALLVQTTGLSSGNQVQQVVLRADRSHRSHRSYRSYRSHGSQWSLNRLLLQVREGTSLIVHPLGLEPAATLALREML